MLPATSERLSLVGTGWRASQGQSRFPFDETAGTPSS